MQRKIGTHNAHKTFIVQGEALMKPRIAVVYRAVLVGVLLWRAAANAATTSLLAGPVVTQLPAPTACAANILACNRLALDDARTTAQVDDKRHEIHIHNTASYDKEAIVADVLLHAEGPAANGAKPYLVHLVISKKGEGWRHRLSPYAVDKGTAKGPFEFDKWTVFVGDDKQPLMAPNLVQQALGKRSLAKRATDFFVRATDLRKQSGESPAVELGLRMGPLNFGFTRARFEPPLSLRQAGANGDLAAALAKEDWSVDFESLSSLVPNHLVRHDLFLFGLDQHPLMAQAMKAGYQGTERLRVGVKSGAGFVQLNDRIEPYPQAAQTATVFLRDTYLGMLLRAQAASMPATQAKN
jgi:hypothetical protein